MEGGTDHDLRILDLPSEEEEEREKSVSGGIEPSKRDDLKTTDGDRKLSLEKDKSEKVWLILLQHSLNTKDITVLSCW